MGPASRLPPRFCELSSGAALLNGHDLASYAADDIRSIIGGCPHDSYAFDATIRDNLRLARPGATDEQLEAAAARARLLPWITSLPTAGISESAPTGQPFPAVNGSASRWPGRFSPDSALLTLDEPTTYLDPAARQSLTADLLQATEGRAVLYITHQSDGLDQRPDRGARPRPGRRTRQPPPTPLRRWAVSADVGERPSTGS